MQCMPCSAMTCTMTVSGYLLPFPPDEVHGQTSAAVIYVQPPGSILALSLKLWDGSLPYACKLRCRTLVARGMFAFCVLHNSTYLLHPIACTFSWMCMQLCLTDIYPHTYFLRCHKIVFSHELPPPPQQHAAPTVYHSSLPTAWMGANHPRTCAHEMYDLSGKLLV